MVARAHLHSRDEKVKMNAVVTTWEVGMMEEVENSDFQVG